MPVNESAVLDHLAAHGIKVAEVDLGGQAWGFYSHERRVIYLQAGMTAGARLATLCHEALHWRRGDVGPQSRAVEDRIDEEVAAELVDMVEYAWAESQCGWSTAGIAAALDLPKWTIRAYRRLLARERANPLAPSGRRRRAL